VDISFKLQLTATDFVQMLLTGVILAIVSALTSVSFSWLEIIVVMVVVIVASLLAQLLVELITAKVKSRD
jgi:hypothetical protein